MAQVSPDQIDYNDEVVLRATLQQTLQGGSGRVVAESGRGHGNASTTCYRYRRRRRRQRQRGSTARTACGNIHGLSTSPNGKMMHMYERLLVCKFDKITSIYTIYVMRMQQRRPRLHFSASAAQNQRSATAQASPAAGRRTPA